MSAAAFADQQINGRRINSEADCLPFDIQPLIG
jgi:hypothetical protein